MAANHNAIIPICSVDAIADNECASVSSHGKDYFVVRRSGALYAYVNCCPHLGTPLEFQENQFLTRDKSFIQCSLHGALFEIDSGKCISGPCQGRALQGVNCRVQGQTIVLEP